MAYLSITVIIIILVYKTGLKLRFGIIQLQIIYWHPVPYHAEIQLQLMIWDSTSINDHYNIMSITSYIYIRCTNELCFIFTINNNRAYVGYWNDTSTDPSENSESRRGHIWRVFRLWLRLITFACRSAHLAYHVHKSVRKTPIVIIFRKCNLFKRYRTSVIRTMTLKLISTQIFINDDDNLSHVNVFNLTLIMILYVNKQLMVMFWNNCKLNSH